MSTIYLAGVGPIAHERKTETIVRQHLHVTFDCPVCGVHHADQRLRPTVAGIDHTGGILEEYMAPCRPCRSGIFFNVRNGEVFIDRTDTPPEGTTY